MTIWTMELEASLKDRAMDIESVVETVLDALRSSPEILGPVMYMNNPERSFGMRFDLEASDARSAVNRGFELALEALSQTRLDAIELYRGTIEVAEAQALTIQDLLQEDRSAAPRHW
jgi:hypothetical protein